MESPRTFSFCRRGTNFSGHYHSEQFHNLHDSTVQASYVRRGRGMRVRWGRLGCDEGHERVVCVFLFLFFDVCTWKFKRGKRSKKRKQRKITERCVRKASFVDAVEKKDAHRCDWLPERSQRTRFFTTGRPQFEQFVGPV